MTVARTRAWGLALALGTAMVSGVAVFLNGDAVRAFGGDATVYTTVKNLVAAALLAGLSSLTVALARMGLGVTALLGWLAVTGRAGDLAGLQPRQWGWALGTGAILAVYVAGWYGALARAQAVDVTAVLVLGALVTALLDAMVTGTTPAPHWLGLALVAAGGLLVPLAGRRVPRRAPLRGGGP